jgi:hypothetical protein
MTPLYIFLFISILNLGLCLHILRKLSKKQQILVNDAIPMNIKLIPKIIESQIVLKNIETPIIEKINQVIVDFNEWKLDVIGPIDSSFSIEIIWSDKTKSVIAGSTPKNFTFTKNKGIIPNHVSNYDHGITYTWKLNYFSWS